MEDTIRIKLSCGTNEEYLRTPDVLIVNLTVGQIKRLLNIIAQLEKTSELNFAEINDFTDANYYLAGSSTPFNELNDESAVLDYYTIKLYSYGGRVESLIWKAQIKHYDTEVFTDETVYVRALRQYLKYMEMPEDELALHLNQEDEVLKGYINKRLKG